MATETETVVAHPTTVDPVDELQKIEKIVDEVKAVEEESSTPCKDTGEEDSIKVEESQIVSPSILGKLEEEEVAPKLESPAIEIKREDEADDKENDQIKPIPESQIPEDIKSVVKEAIDPPPEECVEQLIKDDSKLVDVAVTAVEAEPEEKTSTGLPAELESEEPAIAEVRDILKPAIAEGRDILEPAGNPVVSIEPPANSVDCSQEQDDQPITDPQVQEGGLLAEISAEKEKDDQPSVESLIKKEEEQPVVTSVERELANKPCMEAVIKEEEEEEEEHLTIASSEKEQDEQQQEESVLKEAEEKLSLVSSEKEQEEQPSINIVIKEAEDQLVVGSVGKIPEDQSLAEPTVEEVEDQPEVEREEQPSLSANSIPALEVEYKPTMETEQPVSVLPGEELEPVTVKETTYSNSEATNVESEPTTTTEMEQPEPVLPGEELEPAIVKETTYSESGATNAECEPTTTIEVEQPEPVLPGEELEQAIVKETTYSESRATNAECEPTTTIEVEQPEPVLPGEELEPAIVKETTYSDSGATQFESEPTTTVEMEQSVPVLPEEELGAAIVKEMTDSESGAINDEIPQQEAARLDDKQTEQLQNPDEVCEPQEDAAAETVKDEGILAVDAENTIMVKDGEVCKEVKDIGNSEEERVEQFESAGGDDSTRPVPESIKEEVNESSTVEIVEKLPKDVVLTDEKSEEEDKETKVKTGEENKETEGVIAQLTTVEDVGGSLPTANVAKSSTDEERSCQEVDLIAENKIEEDVKDDNAAVTETSEVECIEKTVDNLATITGDTTEVNTQRSVELSTEEMADADQITKPDVETQEPSTKESDESKSSENQQKEVPSKPAHKHSNNILSKVKQSLVKAKKAIIGKSPGSKNHPSETKGDIQVK